MVLWKRICKGQRRHFFGYMITSVHGYITNTLPELHRNLTINKFYLRSSSLRHPPPPSFRHMYIPKSLKGSCIQNVRMHKQMLWHWNATLIFRGRKAGVAPTYIHPPTQPPNPHHHNLPTPTPPHQPSPHHNLSTTSPPRQKKIRTLNMTRILSFNVTLPWHWRPSPRKPSTHEHL